MKQILIFILLAVLCTGAFADEIYPEISGYQLSGGYLLAMAKNSAGQKSSSSSKTHSKSKKQLGRGISGWNIAGYSLIGVGAICGGLGIYYNSKSEASAAAAASAYDDYKNATSGFDSYWNTYTSKLDQAKQEQSLRNIFYIAGGVSAGIGLILAFLPSSQAEANISFTVMPDYVAFNYRF